MLTDCAVINPFQQPPIVQQILSYLPGKTLLICYHINKLWYYHAKKWHQKSRFLLLSQLDEATTPFPVDLATDCLYIGVDYTATYEIDRLRSLSRLFPNLTLLALRGSGWYSKINEEMINSLRKQEKTFKKLEIANLLLDKAVPLFYPLSYIIDLKSLRRISIRMGLNLLSTCLPETHQLFNLEPLEAGSLILENENLVFDNGFADRIQNLRFPKLTKLTLRYVYEESTVLVLLLSILSHIDTLSLDFSDAIPTTISFLECWDTLCQRSGHSFPYLKDFHYRGPMEIFKSNYSFLSNLTNLNSLISCKMHLRQSISEGPFCAQYCPFVYRVRWCMDAGNFESTWSFLSECSQVQEMEIKNSKDVFPESIDPFLAKLPSFPHLSHIKWSGVFEPNLIETIFSCCPRLNTVSLYHISFPVNSILSPSDLLPAQVKHLIVYHYVSKEGYVFDWSVFCSDTLEKLCISEYESSPSTRFNFIPGAFPNLIELTLPAYRLGAGQDAINHTSIDSLKWILKKLTKLKTFGSIGEKSFFNELKKDFPHIQFYF